MSRGTETPIFIPFRDRITVLRRFVHWLFDYGVPAEMIYVLDMQSSFPETVQQLEDWEKLGVQVRWEKKNHGAWGVFREGLITREIGWDQRFIVNDPDVVPDPDCRPDLLDWLHDVMDKYETVAKLGLGLRLDDLPQTAYRDHAVSHEKRYWVNELEPGGPLYSAPIATTFFLGRSMNHITKADNDPNKSGGDPIPGYSCARTKPPNLGRHLPWYMDSTKLFEDEQYYYDNCPHRKRSKVPGTSWKP